MMKANRDELLFELVMSPYWEALKGVADTLAKEYEVRLTTPAESLMGLVAKEAEAAKLQSIRSFIALVEHRARQFRKSIEGA